MNKKNALLIKCLLGALIVLIPLVLWFSLSSNNASSSASAFSSPSSFLQFLENMIGIHSPNTPGQSNVNHPSGQNTAGPGKTGNLLAHQNPGSMTASMTGLQGKSQEGNTGQNPGIYTESNEENDLGVNADNGSVIDKEIRAENNPGANADNNTGTNSGINSQISTDNNAEINSDNNSGVNADNTSGDNSGTNAADNSGDNSNNSGSSSGGSSGDNSGAGSCVPGCYPGCVPGCDPECTSACFASFSSGNGPGSGSGNAGDGSGYTPPNLPVINPIPSDADVALNVAQQNQQHAQLASLVAANHALAAQAQEAAKYEVSDPSKIVPPDSTPAPQDIVDKIKSAELIQH